MADLPRILAGPIVRRIEPRLACFWIAFSKKGKARAHLWEGVPVLAGSAPDSADRGAAWASSELTDAFRAGERLWIACIVVELAAGGGKILRPGASFSYNIEIQFDGEAPTDLAGEGLLRDEKDADRPGNNVDASAPKHLALGYADNALPSFVTLPATPAELRLAHTSCRKAHGPGYDALAWLDTVIEDGRTGAAATDGSGRPQALFLTGDQIYADDVAACLLGPINRLGHALLGRPGDELVPTLEAECSLANFPPLRRQKLASDGANFTSTEAASHLMSFAEYAATYLLAWSPRVWTALSTADQVFVGLGDLGTSAATRPMLTDWEKCLGSVAAWRASAGKGFEREAANVALFREGVPHVARALANVATYMICDDHEFTDDINLNGKWFDRVYSRPLGKWIVANGMMAYGLFQAWGNDPLSFRSVAGAATVTALDKPDLQVKLATPPTGYGGDAAELTDAAGTKTTGKIVAINGEDVAIKIQGETSLTVGQPVMFAGRSHNADLLAEIAAYTASVAPAPGPTDKLANLCGFGPAGGGEQARWHYGLSQSTYRIAVMDSRTRRKFPDRFYATPSLLGDSLGDQVPAPSPTDELLVLISPAPVLGPEILDRMLQPLVTVLFDAKGYCVDRLRDNGVDPCSPKHALTGAEQFDAEGWSANEAAQEALLARIARFKRVIVLEGDVHYGCSLQMEYWRKGQDSAPSRIAFFTCSPARNGFDSTLAGIARQAAALQRYERGEAAERLYWEKSPGFGVPAGEHVSPGRRARLSRSPAVVPAAGWPASMTVPADKLPDGRWRMRLVRDARAATQVPAALKQPALAGEFAAATALPSFGAIVNRHLAAALDHFDHLRQMVFTCNLGLVRLDADGAGARYKATHTLLSRASTLEPRKSAENTVHVVALETTGEAPPTLHPGS
jgi:hypothetical protein